MRRTRILALCLMVALSASLVYGQSNKVYDVSKGIKIGACGAFTGGAAASGMEMYNSFKLAVDQRNEKGGIKGVKVDLIWGDDGGDAAQGATVGEKLASDPQVYGILGPNWSSVTEAMLRITSEAGIAQITSAASKPSLTAKGYKTFFRVNSKDDDYGPAVGAFIAKDLKAKNVYVLNSKNTYPQGLSDQVVATLDKNKVKYSRATVVEQAKDYSSVLTAVKAANPDVVFVAVMDAPDHAAIISQMRNLGIKAAYVGSEGAKDLKDFVQAAEGKAEGAYMFHMAPDIYAVPAAADYVKQFESKYGSLSGWGPTAYEAACILLDAIEAAAADGKISRDEVVANVKKTKHDGILGFAVEFNAVGDLKSPATYIFQVVNGNFKQVKMVAGD